MDRWLSDISIDDLPEKYRQMAELIGIENVLRLEESYQGEQLYFSSLSKLVAKKKKEYIKAKFTGNNHKDLSRETGFTVMTMDGFGIFHSLKRGGHRDFPTITCFAAINRPIG
ncbi:MAG: hypothetical protein HQL01_15610 [Nitrospirae bacterium]|nr:hypothetical protein [Nitrospirota bacterium]